MEMRSVPRNIDKPNRMPEYAMTFLSVYFVVMFLSHRALAAIVLAALCTYLMYKVTLDKPEGLAMRVIYRYIQLGGLKPTPRRCKKLEV